jgi:hypothetical protein
MNRKEDMDWIEKRIQAHCFLDSFQTSQKESNLSRLEDKFKAEENSHRIEATMDAAPEQKKNAQSSIIISNEVFYKN